MKVVYETIHVRGEFQSSAPDASSFNTSYNEATGFSTVVFPVYTTRHGPIVDPIAEDVRKLNGSFGSTNMPAKHAVSLRWVALEPTNTVSAILELDRAQNFDEFRAALSRFDDPTQNIIYADVDGNIGYQTPGRIPIRAHGDGLLPVPGWTDEYEWLGYIPHEKLPFVYNPPNGYVVAANNAIVRPDYPYLITLEWDPGTRAQRIVDLLETHKGQPITRDTIIQMQNDTFDIAAQEMVEYLKPLQFGDANIQNALNTLLAWDFKTEKDSSSAALYSIFLVEFTKMAFGDELTIAEWPNVETINRLMKDKNNQWWDDVATSEAVETRDDILHKAFMAAYQDAEKAMGSDRATWQWGKMHTGLFRQSPLGYSGISVVDSIFNRGPYPFSGSAATINATYWVWNTEEVDAASPSIYETVSFPSMRMIIDLNDFQESLMVNPPGASGHPFNQHYDDMIDLWLNGKYHPLSWNRSYIETSAADYLLLTP
jgi:penicillin amidase